MNDGFLTCIRQLVHTPNFSTKAINYGFIIDGCAETPQNKFSAKGLHGVSSDVQPSNMEYMDVMNGKQAALVLRCSQRQLLRYRNSGKLKYIKIGRRILYSELHLSEFIDQHTVDQFPIKRPMR